MIQKAIQQTQLSVKEVCHSIQAKVESDLKCTSQVCSFPGGGTLGISGWGCAAATLEPLAYTRASSAEFCYPTLE